jgi:hypothetical protein
MRRIGKGEQDGNRQLCSLVLAVLSAILSAACWLLWLATPLTFGALAGFAGVAVGIAVSCIAETRRLWHHNKGVAISGARGAMILSISANMD